MMEPDLQATCAEPHKRHHTARADSGWPVCLNPCPTRFGDVSSCALPLGNNDGDELIADDPCWEGKAVL